MLHSKYFHPKKYKTHNDIGVMDFVMTYVHLGVIYKLLIYVLTYL